MSVEPSDRFQARHLGPRDADVTDMLRVIGVPSLEALIDQAIPASIRATGELQLPPALTEFAYLSHLRGLAERNHVFKSYIGLGYADTITPSVILRTVFENPSWYTPYTPYQAEVAQGRLESLLNFQTMVRDLTGMEVANASLLDEATAAAEAMTLLHRVQTRQATEANTFVVSDGCFPQTIDVVRLRAEPLGIQVVVADPGSLPLDSNVFGVLLQSPDRHGFVQDLRPAIDAAHAAGALVAVASDLLALTIVTPPGEMGADVVLGNSQRFGVPLGFGGPHAAFFATRETYLRQLPGRVIGVSVDAHGQRAYRMTLQTREQHIRREKATSNICTAQALLANIAAFYAVYHGPQGLTAIATRVHELAAALTHALEGMGCTQLNDAFFDTIRVRVPGGVEAVEAVRASALAAQINFRYDSTGEIGIALDETTTLEDLGAIVAVFASAQGNTAGLSRATPDAPESRGLLRATPAAPESTGLPRATPAAPESRGLSRATPDAPESRGLSWIAATHAALPVALRRTSPFLTHPVFNTHHSETEMMRYVKALERKDVGLDTSMIPLGSCTMKLNAASEMRPVSWPEFSRLHPFAPLDQAAGYVQIFRELEAMLCEITGFAAVSLQPNSGAQGELAGLMVIRAYLRDRGEGARTVVLIPSSAHGTNPASAIMAGMEVVVVACDAHGNVDVDDLRAKAGTHRARLAALMVTYPSTHGVFEERIRDICAIVHEHGGQVYMDGANMNAQVGLTSPALIGADVCHLNLHKTFAIPHGGGGPGMGPIGVATHLAPYLPGHPLTKVGGDRAIPAVAAAPWGSASILLISYGYMRMLGAAGMTAATKYALLTANYLKSKLESHYRVLYARETGRVAHEVIFDLREFKKLGVDEIDVAKRLMDYGFHAPTVSFPVPGTLMVEPTESEPKGEIDRFCDALIAIRQELRDIADGRIAAKDSALKHAPHTAGAVAADDWTHPYTRTQAAFPLPFVRANKFWPSVGRIDNPYGDRNLFCVCPPLEEYAETR